MKKKEIRLNEKLISSLSTVLFIPAAELIVATSIANSTWYRIMQTPVVISIQQLLSIANSLHIPVRRFFSMGKTDVIGRREDYIADSYKPCHYDGAALQRIVDEHPDATWKKAAKATGMNYTRLRESLTGETRTPVVRFLNVCRAFDIDPFTILTDPNPEPKKNRRNTSGAAASTTTDSDALRAEVAALRDDVHALSLTVDELTAKYKTLLADHEKLARRVNVSIENIHNSYIGIAADTDHR